jgi:prepilin-type N-terminal cleavage/methylation domain-containing protein
MKLLNKHRGFTIVELMIATTVLSVILLLVTGMMISIGNLFYKGVNQARVQDDVRSISDEFAEQLKYSGSDAIQPAAKPETYGSTTYNVRVICIAGTRYTYVLGTQIGTGASHIPHVLWRDSWSGACTQADLTINQPTPKGVELIAPNSRLSNLIISASSPYDITVTVSYGDDDLMNNPSSTTPICIGNTGDQFCAVAGLHTIAVRRLLGGL